VNQLETAEDDDEDDLGSAYAAAQAVSWRIVIERRFGNVAENESHPEQ
jgi:hypothetical protein